MAIAGVGPRQYPLSKPLTQKEKEEESSNAKKTTADANSSDGNLKQSKGLQYTDGQAAPVPKKKSLATTKVISRTVIDPNAEPTNQPQVNINRPLTRQQQAQRLPQQIQQPPAETQTPVHTQPQQFQPAPARVQVQPQQFQQPQPASQSRIGAEPQATPSGFNVRSTKINIAQILKDFKNTAFAIGTPEDLVSEVDDYIDIIKKQISKDEPPVKVIQSNLKNAALILDKYISDTLNKDSKVVQNWVDAVFLQDVNYKYNEEEVNQDFLVNFPEQQKQPEEPKEQAPVEPEVVVDNDKELKEKFIKAKKQASLEQFKEVLTMSATADDKEIMPKATFEIGKIYDKQDNLPEALDYYQQTVTNSNDKNLKCQAHFSMAKIYDDVNKFEPAIDHYFVAIGYAGETENLEAQSTFLTKLANMFTDKYDDCAFDYYEAANEIATNTNPKTRGYVSSNTATAYNRFNKPKDAMKYYSDAIQNYSELNSLDKIALNYKRAGQLMADYNKKDKAKVLLQKAMGFAMQTNNRDMMKEINKELSSNM